VGKDVNQGQAVSVAGAASTTGRSLSWRRRGWAANLDYDKLQDLAENHRSLPADHGHRRLAGEVDFDWRRIEDNLLKLRPQTLKKISALVVKAGHALEPKAIAAVRGDTFVVETNIHYPTESTLLGDGLRKILPLAAELAVENELTGWRQYKHRLRTSSSWCTRLAELRAPRSRSGPLEAGLQKTSGVGRGLVGAGAAACWGSWPCGAQAGG